jgi:hypothetical protein
VEGHFFKKHPDRPRLDPEIDNLDLSAKEPCADWTSTSANEVLQTELNAKGMIVLLLCYPNLVK